ncbi:hypothetical protein BSQ97_23470 [Serratia proteamaculans]|nr:hypothetical protein BSQ97_23470 [Serratia proteamaculans]RYM50538.1 hypothetical protein BSQ96_17230 [Serratia proteamaculans]
MKLHLCWLHSFTRITYSCKLIGIHSLTALMQLQLLWVYYSAAKWLFSKVWQVGGRGGGTGLPGLALG